MGCSSCGVGSNGAPTGCGDKGNCGSGGCNKLNTYDWISTKDLSDPSQYHIVEVSFKNGAHKDFFINDPHTQCVTGDMVVVETSSGYDLGKISLSGELVRLQMKKKYTQEERIAFKIIRKANERDIEKLEQARSLEKETMVKARVISRTMGLDMKIGDIEYQGDKKKATFYYTAEGRVDFRELVKEYAREFKVKIEMRQIGARQESARIGGIGSCGRELCCSTWLSDFKSVNTAAARYQNIAINQSKLSGQCGRLKCCLNYELDTYMDALEDFPNDADILKVKDGNARLLKTDIFKGLLYYIIDNDKMRGNIIAVDKNRVKEIKALNKKGIYPDVLVEQPVETTTQNDVDDANFQHEYEDVTGLIELRNEPRKNRNKNKQKGPRPNNSQNNSQNNRQDNRQDNPQNKSQNKSQNNTQNNPGGVAPKEGSNPQSKQEQRNTNPNQQNQNNNRPKGPKPNPPRPNNQPKPNHPNQQNKAPNSPVGDESIKDNTANPNNAAEGSVNNPANNPAKKKKFFNKNRKPKDGQ